MVSGNAITGIMAIATRHKALFIVLISSVVLHQLQLNANSSITATTPLSEPIIFLEIQVVDFCSAQDFQQ